MPAGRYGYPLPTAGLEQVRQSPVHLKLRTGQLVGSVESVDRFLAQLHTVSDTFRMRTMRTLLDI